MSAPDPPIQAVVLGLDIGGANLKAADGGGWHHEQAFALWRRPEGLAAALRALVVARGPRRVVATMTGEIADCFATRTAGVTHIVSSLQQAAAGTPLHVYTVDETMEARFVTPEEAVKRPMEVAAANWHALAHLAARHVPTDRCLLLDIGSTTCDLVPITDGVPVPFARHDAARLLSGELVYTGVERTPVPAITSSLPHRGCRRPVAAERFADSRDAWLLLGGLPEHGGPCDTADGGPATRDAARIRLARTLLLDPESFTAADAEAAARRIAARQARAIARGIATVSRWVGWRPTGVVISGHGEALAHQALEQAGLRTATVSLPEILGAGVARVAPAHAVALLARESLR
jgi:probable H4MPT-linked C1 transfer pathway protein